MVSSQLGSIFFESLSSCAFNAHCSGFKFEILNELLCFSPPLILWSFCQNSEREWKRTWPKFLRGRGLFKQTHKSEERVTHWLRHSAALHMAGEVCPHGAKPGGHVCLPLTFIWAHFHGFFCHQYPELLVASYNNNEDAPHEPDGVALVWNMKYKKATPEYVFHCQVLEAPLLVSPSPPCVLTGGCLHDKCGAPPTNPSPTSFPCVHAPLTLLPSCTLWVHHTGIQLHHIYPQTHVHVAPAKTCGAGLKSEHCDGIKCVGPGWLSCASKQGPCVQTS